MNNYYRKIAEDLESGLYFRDAKEWYQLKYIFPVIGRSFFIFLTVISIATTIIAFYVLISFLPLTKKVPIVVEIEDMAREYSIISRVPLRTKENPNSAIIKYLLTRYIRAFERYDPKDDFEILKRNLSHIEKFSLKNVVDRYKFYISVRNPEGLLLRYRKHTKRKIDILKYTFHITAHTKKNWEKEKENPRAKKYTAFVDFIGHESNINGKKSDRWKARIDFIFSDVKFDRENGEFLPLNFSVVNYQSVKINNEK